MRELIKEINRANKNYYDGPTESDLENAQYDKLMQELLYLEKSSGVILPKSPTRKVGGNAEGKVRHAYPILSLQNTKDISDVEDLLGAREGVLSWKLDGVAAILYYKNGKLDKAVTRGDGYFGKDVTRNLLACNGVSEEIGSRDSVIIRGECVLSHKSFDEINDGRAGGFSNPRNTVAGAINSNRGSKNILGSIDFIAHTLYEHNSPDPLMTYSEQIDYMEDLGFTPIEYVLVDYENIWAAIAEKEEMISRIIYPCDGLVIRHNNLEYGEKLGVTEKYPKHSIAFKWQDEEKDVKVTGMTWSVGGTGLITPVVQYEPVRLEGTVCSNANLHSLKKFKELEICMGDILTIYKANKIVPTVLCNKNKEDVPWISSGVLGIPKVCPNCGGEVKSVITKTSEQLYCMNKCKGVK